MFTRESGKCLEHLHNFFSRGAGRCEKIFFEIPKERDGGGGGGVFFHKKWTFQRGGGSYLKFPPLRRYRYFLERHN